MFRLRKLAKSNHPPLNPVNASKVLTGVAYNLYQFFGGVPSLIFEENKLIFKKHPKSFDFLRKPRIPMDSIDLNETFDFLRKTKDFGCVLKINLFFAKMRDGTPQNFLI